MMINNNNMNDEKFVKGIASLKRITLTPRQKGEIFHSLRNYAEARPAPSESWVTLFLRSLKSLVSARIK